MPVRATPGRARYLLILCLAAVLLVVAGTASAIVFKPPFTKGTALTSGGNKRHGCAQLTVFSANLTNGEVRADSYVHAGNIINPCLPSYINLTGGFASPKFAPTYSGTHKISFEWTLSWNAWLNSTCGHSGCSDSSAAIDLQALLIDETNRTTVKVANLLVFSATSGNGSHLSFGQSATNFTIVFSAYLNGSHAYELRTVLKEGEYAAAPAGGLYCSARVNAGTGADGGWLVSMSSK